LARSAQFRTFTPAICAGQTGPPEGGLTYEQFVEIMGRGTDFDPIHPNCTAPGTPTDCFEPQFNGDLLQVMRWPSFRNMTDHELRAIYEYLKAISCNPGQVIAGARPTCRTLVNNGAHCRRNA
jgi:hypothetical protein